MIAHVPRTRSVILDSSGSPYPRPAVSGDDRMFVRAKYDAAQTTENNRRHWANADYLSANASASPTVRRELRARARYETANNCYAKGIVRTLASDVIGGGPRLQILLNDPELDREIESVFMEWALAINLAEKLRTMRMAIAQDGEAFAVFRNNDQLPTEIRLDLQLVEADMVAAPWQEQTLLSDKHNVDGVQLDDAGNPISYTFLKQHPGDIWAGIAREYTQLPASRVIHWFVRDRPGQARGIPELTPALPLFSQLRRYTLAVLGAAEAAADWALIFKTNQPPGDQAAEVPMDVVFETVSRMAVFAPEGWEPSQIRAEQPSTTYEAFKHELLNEIARCLDMPFNIAAGNAAGYNYASVRSDSQTYAKSIEVQRSHVERVVLDRILATWLDEARMIPGLLSGGIWQYRRLPPHEWLWASREHVDPAKHALGQKTRLSNDTTNLAIECGHDGRDWETVLRQRARELEVMRELGMM